MTIKPLLPTQGQLTPDFVARFKSMQDDSIMNWFFTDATPTVTCTLCGMTVQTDATLPNGTLEFRHPCTGDVMGRIVNIGVDNHD